jgi:fimbrial chaperone protein
MYATRTCSQKVRSTRILTRAALAVCALWSAIGAGVAASYAATLRIEPVLVEVYAPGAASTITLKNDDSTECTVQIRAFKWSQTNGAESLVPTTDIAVSPPMVKLAPQTSYVARIVRVAGRPIQAEESYRIFVDQLPQANNKPAQQVSLLIRQSIPVFFNARRDEEANVKWSLGYDASQLVVTAQNSGGKRLRISALSLRDGAGRTLSFGTGLAGYVLSGSKMQWRAPEKVSGFGVSGSVEINAQTDTGPIHVTVPAPGAN